MVARVVAVALWMAGCAGSQDLARGGAGANAERTQALHVAVRAGDEPLVRQLLDRGADTSAADGAGNTPLALAASAGRPGLVRLLLEHGARLDVSNRVSYTPLMWACESGSVPAVQLLLDRNAVVNASDARGVTPLMSALAMGGDQVARLLLARGAAVNVADREGRTPLMHAVDGVVHGRFGGDPLSGVQLLLDAGADAGAMSKTGKTALAMAAAIREQELRSRLLRVLLARPGAIGIVLRLERDGDATSWRISYGRARDDEALVLNASPTISVISGARVPPLGAVDPAAPGAAELCAALGNCKESGTTVDLPLALRPGMYALEMGVGPSATTADTPIGSAWHATTILDARGGALYVLSIRGNRVLADAVSRAPEDPAEAIQQ